MSPSIVWFLSQSCRVSHEFFSTKTDGPGGLASDGAAILVESPRVFCLLWLIIDNLLAGVGQRCGGRDLQPLRTWAQRQQEHQLGRP